MAKLATDASGDSTKALYGDGNFKAPSGGPVQSITVSISSAQLLALNTTSLTIIAAPGSGSMVLVLASIYEVLAGTIVYSSAGGNPPGLYCGYSSGSPANNGSTSNPFVASVNSIAYNGYGFATTEPSSQLPTNR